MRRRVPSEFETARGKQARGRTGGYVSVSVQARSLAHGFLLVFGVRLILSLVRRGGKVAGGEGKKSTATGHRDAMMAASRECNHRRVLVAGVPSISIHINLILGDGR